jgi:hypothetical protein
MKIVQVNKTKEIFPLMFPQEIKGDKLEYFQKGEGYKKTKSFTILPEELPERWTELSWLEVAKIGDKYGLEVADCYASCKTAGIVSKQTANGYIITYQTIKDLIPENFDSAFFECLVADYMCACFGLYLFDIIGTEKELAAINPEYDAINATYKGENVSMKEFVLQRYGADYVKIIESLIK